MSLSTNEALDTVIITRNERKALAALLYSGLTGSALDKMGLHRLQVRLSVAFKEHWGPSNGLDEHPVMRDYGVDEHVSPDSTQRTRNSIQ